MLTNHSTGELVFGVARIFASFNDTFVREYPFGFDPSPLIPSSTLEKSLLGPEIECCLKEEMLTFDVIQMSPISGSCQIYEQTAA